MLTSLLIALLQVSTPAPASVRPSVDTLSPADSARQERRRQREKRPPKRVEMTPALLASAYASPAAREILLLARAARLRQDSALQSYDATTYQRFSTGLGLGRIGRNHLAYRSEQSTRVRWRRGSGAYVEVTGSRAVAPIAGKGGQTSMNGSISPVPYYPGSESLWIGSSVARDAVNENDGLVHPLAEGAEAYYTYESGDSVTFRLPNGKSIRLRELRVRPRQPKWNLAVGSLWFDMAGGQLVRAAYRMASPMDIGTVARNDDSSAFDDVPMLMKPLMFPMTAQVSAIGVEYGLYEGRFWLPRLQVAEGSARAGVLRVPFELQQKFEYADVNAGAPLPPIVVATADTLHPRDAVDVSVTVGSPDRPQTARDSARAQRRAARLACDSTGTRTYTRTSRGGVNPRRVTISCDMEKLAHSPDLPPSIYAEGDQAVDRTEIDALVEQALAMGAQAEFAPQLPVTGMVTPRYNRIEGLSLGVRADQELGAGYSAHALARLGIADRQPVLELSASRSDMRRTLTLTAYNRLVSASDYGNPFGFGSSLSALLFARDEAYYYRATGVELGSAPDQVQGNALSYGVFVEHERSASRRTTFALTHGTAGFGFDTNLVAARGMFVGARARMLSTVGLDPQGFRLNSNLSAEAAHGDTGSYARIALDLDLSHPVPGGAASLTLAGGTSAGALPVQRNWFLGGAQTVRGQRAALVPGRMGNAFWLGRAELARGMGVVRPLIFADMGWAGDRTRPGEIGRPVSGAGVGASVLDGLLRFDVARGINPDRDWRVYTYLEGRF